MLVKSVSAVPSSEITDRSTYLRRREFLQTAVGAALAAATSLASPSAQGGARQKLAGVKKGPFGTTEEWTPYDDVTTYNNFYEFGIDKDDPSAERRQPQDAALDGEGRGRGGEAGACTRSRTFCSPHRARGARVPPALRRGVVDGDSVGRVSAGRPDQAVEPTSQAKYVEFTTLLDPGQMPGQRRAVLEWPYVEGLRMDEAMHPLTILAVGLYGEALPNQNGAPLRLVVPWKYGFKGIKSIVRIRFVEKQPRDGVEHAGARASTASTPTSNPERRSSALEPGERAAHRRVLQAQDADVQRLRRAGRIAVYGHGPASKLLRADACPSLPYRKRTELVFRDPSRLRSSCCASSRWPA